MDVRLAALVTVVAWACGPQAPREQARRTEPRVDHWAAAPTDARVVDVPVADAGAACITAAEAARPLAVVREMLDAAVPGERGEPTLVTDACSRLVYEYGEHRVAVRRKPDGSISASSYSASTSPECLDETIERATKLLPYAHVIIDAGRRHFGDEWTEPGSGVARWVTCGDPSFATLLHEVNHFLRSGDCLHDPRGEPICFDGLAVLPPRKFARVEALPVKEPLRKLYEQTRDVYLTGTAGDDSVLLLHDELLAYGISAESQAAVVRAGLGGDHAVLLPLIAYLTVHYWDKLKSEEPQAFELALGPTTKNRAAFERLLARSERAYAAWRDARGTNRKGTFARQMSRTEDVLWKEYLVAKRRVLR